MKPSGPTKVIIGITKSNLGGAQRYVFDMALGAREVGFDVAVLCGGHGVLVDKLQKENIRVITIPTFGRDISWYKDFLSLLFIIKTIWKEKPHVFHLNSAKMGGAGIFTGLILKVPKVIFTAHGWAFNEPRPMWQRMIIKFFSWLTIVGTDKTICVSEKTKSDIAEWPFIKNKLVVIHNGLKPFELKSRENHEFTIGAVSELHKIKGLDILLKAWKKFRENHHATLFIVGEGEERKNLEKLAKDLNISDSVVFKGFVDNAGSQLSSFDIFVLPSRSEALPYALLEAGFAGLPVIASSVGGIPEVIENEQNGLLVPKENVEQLASALTRLFENPSFRESLGKNLKQTIETKFSLEKMLRETFALYGSK